MVWHKPAMEQQELDELVPVVKAAELLGVRRQTLDQKLRRRGLSPVRRVVGGRVLVYLPKGWLAELGTDQAPDQVADQAQLQIQRAAAAIAARAAPDQAADQVPDQPQLRAEMAELRAKLDAALAEVHALGGKLAGAEYVERATGRRCDKLEQRVEAMQAELVAQARELGKRDTLVVMLRDQVTDRDQQLEKLEEVAGNASPWWLPRILKGG